MPALLSQGEFIKRCIETHGDCYDYTSTIYVKSSEKVTIRCLKHGDFLQYPRDHIRGHGCPKCKKVEHITTSEFIKRAKDYHGDRYDYSNSVYVNQKTLVSVTCNDHGPFLVRPANHWKGVGCPVCRGPKKKPHNTKQFIKDAKKIHGDRYDYSKSVYTKNKDQITVICKKHGEFSLTPKDHKRGNGCPKCGQNQRLGDRRVSFDEFCKRANEIHNNKYKYHDDTYSGTHNKVNIICHKHGYFEQIAKNHLIGAGCPTCSIHLSKNEQSIFEFIKLYCPDVSQRDRELIAPYELDIIIPSRNIAIEYNGLLWHSDLYKSDKYYHANKTKLCNKAGYRLIHVWEDEYINSPEIQKRFILNALGVLQSKSIAARKTTIEKIPKNTARDFLLLNHIQGAAPSSLDLGIKHKEDVIGVASFLCIKSDWQMVRFATSTRVIGGLSKVASYFRKNVSKSFFTFCDLSRHDGKSYEKAGFIADFIIKPDYTYLVKGERKHKFGFRRKHIKRQFPLIYSENKTEKEMMIEAGIPRIWDCGKIRYRYAG